MVVGGMVMISGIFLPQARPMIAVGASILVFVFTAKYFGKS